MAAARRDLVSGSPAAPARAPRCSTATATLERLRQDLRMTALLPELERVQAQDSGVRIEIESLTDGEDHAPEHVVDGGNQEEHQKQEPRRNRGKPCAASPEPDGQPWRDDAP